MALMKIEFGTKQQRETLFEIDDYGTVETIIGSTVEEKKKAYDLLHETMNNWTFIDDGCRNEDAVNSCIALHVLGYDPCEWFGNFFDDNYIREMFFDSDIDSFMDHIYRICGYGFMYNTNYLFRWGPEGNEGAALNYAI